MRFRLIATVLVVFAVVVAGILHAQQAPGAALMMPGLWEITVQTRSPIVGPLLTHTVCVDKALVARPAPPKAKASDDCQVQPDPSATNETAYTIRCTKLAASSSWRMTYSGDHFDGTAVIHTAGGEVRQIYSGRRVSACDNQTADQ